ADAAVLNAAVGERGQSMRASEAEQAHPTVRVTKHDEVFAQEAYGFRLAARLEVDRIAGRDPVAAKPVAARRIRADLADQLVLFFREHSCLPPFKNPQSLVSVALDVALRMGHV